MEQRKMKQIKQISVIICSAAAILSLAIFIPYIRELIILFCEKLIGRPLTHEVWHERFIEWEFCFLLFIVAIYIFLCLIQNFPKKILMSTIFR